MEPLEAATTSQLLDELGRRFKAVVVCGIRPDQDAGTVDGPNAEDELRFYYKGGLTMGFGLLERLRRFLNVEAAIIEGDIEDMDDEAQAEE